MEILAECGPTMTLPHLVWGWATRFLAKTRSRIGRLAAELRRLTLVDVLHRCRELRETRHFIDYDDLALPGNNPGFPQPAQNAVHVHEGQPEMIGDFLLEHRAEGLVIDAAEIRYGLEVRLYLHLAVCRVIPLAN